MGAESAAKAWSSMVVDDWMVSRTGVLGAGTSRRRAARG